MEPKNEEKMIEGTNGYNVPDYSLLPPPSYFAEDYTVVNVSNLSENPPFNPDPPSPQYIEDNPSFNPDPPSPPHNPETTRDKEESTKSALKSLRNFHILSIFFCLLSIFFWFFEIIPAVGTVILFLKFKEKQTKFLRILCVIDIIVTSVVCFYYVLIFFAITVVTMGFGMFTSWILFIPYFAVIINCCISLFGNDFTQFGVLS